MPGRIYLDHHATTPVDPRVVEAMLPFFTEVFGNSSSVSHAWGREAREAVERSRAVVAEAVGALPEEITFTSGATESNNLALRGLAEQPRNRQRHLVSVVTEHRAILDPLERLRRLGFRVTLLPVRNHPADFPGELDLDQLVAALEPETLVVSVMLANNEVGVIQPLAELARLCAVRGILVHCDAVQALGKMPLDVRLLGVDLISFSAHKLYGPKGVGALYVRRRSPPIRLAPLIVGGGQEKNLRSGTLNVPAIVGFAKAVELSMAEMAVERPRLAQLRQELFDGLRQEVGDCYLNGPSWEQETEPGQLRLPGNLNLRFAGVDGEMVMLHTPTVALSSGSACSSQQSGPSHVLRALGLSEEDVRSSLRIGLGRGNTSEEVQQVVARLAESIGQLRRAGAEPVGLLPQRGKDVLRASARRVTNISSYRSRIAAVLTVGSRCTNR